MDEIVVVEIKEGAGSSYVIAKAWDELHQFPSIMPVRYSEVARVRDPNDIGPVASAFCWKPEET